MERMTWLAVLGLAAGCTDGAAPPILTGPSLASSLEVTVAQPTAESGVTFDVSSWKEGSTAHLTLAPSDLRLVLRTGKHGEITGLELPLSDQDISADSFPPSGLKLRNLQLGLDDTAELQTLSASEDYLELHADAPLRLAWSVVLADGSVYALGPAVTEPLSFDVEVQRNGAEVTARVYAQCSGDCWKLDGIARIANGQLHLVAPATLKPLD